MTGTTKQYITGKLLCSVCEEITTHTRAVNHNVILCKKKNIILLAYGISSGFYGYEIVVFMQLYCNSFLLKSSVVIVVCLRQLPTVTRECHSRYECYSE